MDSEMNNDQGPNIGLWLGIAVGAAIGIGIAMSRRKRSPWDQARRVASNLSDHTGDFAAATSNIMERVRTIYDEGCKVVEEAGELWNHGRKLVAR
jgi:ABC-type Zn2+ transport system substrate-binding protein/surface adhesin